MKRGFARTPLAREPRDFIVAKGEEIVLKHPPVCAKRGVLENNNGRSQDFLSVWTHNLFFMPKFEN
jgi:hypothetical protein